MKKLFKKKEFDKLSQELLNEIYPLEGLNNYYCLGFASALDAIDEFINTYHETFTKEDFKYVIKYYTKSHEKINEYFNRLQKDQ